jgi:hypothetical protein
VIPLRGRDEIAARLDLAGASSVLLVDAPDELSELLAAAARPDQSIRSVGARTLRSVKEPFDLVLAWRESRVGAQALLDAAIRRLAPGGRLWTVTALRKVTGPRTPAVHRLDRADLDRALGPRGLSCDREARLSAWHVAYGFVEAGRGGAQKEPGHST